MSFIGNYLKNKAKRGMVTTVGGKKATRYYDTYTKINKARNITKGIKNAFAPKEIQTAKQFEKETQFRKADIERKKAEKERIIKTESAGNIQRVKDRANDLYNKIMDSKKLSEKEKQVHTTLLKFVGDSVMEGRQKSEIRKNLVSHGYSAELVKDALIYFEELAKVS